MTTLLEQPQSEPAQFSFDWFGEWPLLFEDCEDEVSDIGWHYLVGSILVHCIDAHLMKFHKKLQVFGNFAIHYAPPNYPKLRLPPNVAPDVSVFQPKKYVSREQGSYSIGRDGPAPLLVIEALSERTAKDRDLHLKPILYALLGIREYVLIDASRRYVPERIVLKQLQHNGRYRDLRDPDGGITSRLGFRIILDDAGLPMVLEEKTGRTYLRPNEAQLKFDAVEEKLDAVVSERDAVVSERDAVVSERDAAVSERDAAVSERDAAMSERDAAVSERDALAKERNDLTARIAKLEAELKQAKR